MEAASAVSGDQQQNTSSIPHSSPTTSQPPPHHPPPATPSPPHSASEQYARQTHVPRRIHMLGTGSIGKLVAHALRGIQDPPPITLIFHRHKLLQAWEQQSKKQIVIETDGYAVPRDGFDVELVEPRLKVHGAEVGQESAQSVAEREIDTESDPDTEPAVDDTIYNLIVSVKAPFTVSAISSVKHRLRPESTICFLQNGMGIIDQINEQVFPDPATRPNYMQGIINHGANSPKLNDPFFAVHAGHGTITLAVLRREEDQHQVDPNTTDNPHNNLTLDALQKPVKFQSTSRYLIRTLTRTPILSAVGVPPLELLQLQLEKLAINAVINPLTVLLDAPNGSVLYNFSLTRVARLLLAEISLVLRSLPELRGLPNAHHRFAPERLETLVVAVADRTARNVSSMLADVRAGRQTEVRFINGYFVRRGEELGVQCVCNYLVMQLVEGKKNMIERELADAIPVERLDLTGER